MHILITNDDGISSPGLLALAEELSKLGKITVLAPDHNWSSLGHVKKMDISTQLKEMPLSDKFASYASDGSPSDCVALAASGFIKERIDLVISGINPFPNLSHDITSSGTVAAAMEASIWGFPAIAVSLDSPHRYSRPIDYTASAKIALSVARSVIRYGLPPSVFLNVNVPYVSYDLLKGIRVTRQNLLAQHDETSQFFANIKKVYGWMPKNLKPVVHERGTDSGELAAGFVSVTPIQLDLTAYKTIPHLNSWDWRAESWTAAPGVITDQQDVDIQKVQP